MKRKGCKPARVIDGAFYWRLEDVVAWREKNLHAAPAGPERRRGRSPPKGRPAPGPGPGPFAPRSPEQAPETPGDPAGLSEGDDDEDTGGSRIGRGAPQTVIEADLRLKHAREQLALLELRKRSGELAPVQEVRQAWSRRVSTAKRLLESLPPSVAQDVCAACGLGADTAPRIEKVVADAFAQAMQRLAAIRADDP